MEKKHLQMVLLLNVFTCFGLNYTFDFPQAISDMLINDMHMNTLDISLLYSICFFPNLLLSPLA